MARRRSPLGFGGVLALALVVLLGFGWLTGMGPSLPNPFASDKVENHQPALLQDLRDISEYHAASATLQQLVDLEDDARYLPDFIRGEHVTMSVTGSVDGIVDFSRLADEALVIDGESASLTLPAAHLGPVTIDHEATQLVDRDRGLLDRLGDVFTEDPGSDREVLILAEATLAEAAGETDLLERAESNAETMLRALLGRFGITDVTVTFVDPDGGNRTT